MARKFRFCLHCRRSITESEVARGEFVKTRFGTLCPQCAKALEEQEPPEPTPPPEPPKPEPAPVPEPEPAPPKPESPPPPEPLKPEAPMEAVPAAPPAPRDEKDLMAILRDLRQDVEAIRRMLIFERTSPWNVIAIVAQCAAGSVFLIALLQWHENPMNLLLAVLILQGMALTFFVKGK